MVGIGAGTLRSSSTVTLGVSRLLRRSLVGLRRTRQLDALQMSGRHRQRDMMRRIRISGGSSVNQAYRILISGFRTIDPTRWGLIRDGGHRGVETGFFVG